MADITMCSNWEDCPMAKDCLRATAKAASHNQSYAHFQHKCVAGAPSWCTDYMSNATVETKTNPPPIPSGYAEREQKTPVQEWEAWVSWCFQRSPRLNPNQTGTLWAYREMNRLRKVITELEKKE